MRSREKRSAGSFCRQRPAAWRAALLVAGVLLGTTVSLVGGTGCGGGGGKGNVTPATGAVATASGRAVVSVRWPERSAASGRLVPLAAESIRVTVFQNDAPLEEHLLTRPAGNGSVTTSAEFALLPTGNLLFRAEAFPNADGSGVLQARAEAVEPIAADFVTPVSLTLGSTIDRVEITPASPPPLTGGETTTFTATAKNAAGEIVVTTATWQWSTGDPAIATVEASTGLVSALAAGATTVLAKETESGKTGQVTLQTTPSPPPQITTSPTLSPAFNPEITDYVVPSGTDASVPFTVGAPKGTTVAVDGQPARNLTFTTQVNNLGAGQRFSFVVNSPSGAKTYQVRRLPVNFPTLTTERAGTPQAEYYVVTPNLPNDTRNYVIIADNYGVPIWWFRAAARPIDAKILPNGSIGWLTYLNNPMMGVVRGFDGTLQRSLLPHASLGGNMDQHELQLLPNGNYLFIVSISRSHVDLSPFGGASDGTILDQVIEEIAPDGTLVWNWSAMEHLSLTETGPFWRSQITDPFHMNAVEPDGDGYVVSFRHLDAVVRIDRATGAIVWKLGGAPRPESLAFVGDPFGNFGGQHDARILSDGTLTVHDNGSSQARAPRAVRFRLDTVARTATFVEQVTDSEAQTAGSSGSARKLAGGDWVTEWGTNPFVTELAPDGSIVLRIRFQSPFYSYRAAPVPFGTVKREDLRNGMDVQFPR